MSTFFAKAPALLLGASAVAVSHTGSVSETVLATISIPAGIIGASGILQVRSFWTVTANTNTKTARARLGGLAGTVVGVSPAWNAAAVTNPAMTNTIMNRDSVVSQFCNNLCSRSSDLLEQVQANITTAVDTAVAQDLVLTGQLGTDTDTITLEGYIVELLRP